MRFRYRNDHIGFDSPSIRPASSKWLVSSIPFGRSIIRPRRQSVDVGFREFGRVPEIAVSGVREPGRHLLAQNGFLNRLGPWTCAFVGLKRHRCNLTGPVTVLTIRLEYWKDILIERYSAGLAVNTGRNLRRQRCYRRQNNDREESRHNRLLGCVGFFGT